MSLKDTEDIYIYLSSLADGGAFPQNTSSEFENRIQPIYLNANREYEMGLCNILFPRYFYCITQADPNSLISFYGRVQQPALNAYEYSIYTYLPERNIPCSFSSANIGPVTKAINNQIKREIGTILGESYDTYFPHADIIYYDDDLERVVVNNSLVPVSSNNTYYIQ